MKRKELLRALAGAGALAFLGYFSSAATGKPVYYYDGASYYLAVWDESAGAWRKVTVS